MTALKFFGSYSHFLGNLSTLNTANSSTSFGTIYYHEGDSIPASGSRGTAGDIGDATTAGATGMLNFSENAGGELFNLATVTGSALVYGTLKGHDTLIGGLGAETIYGGEAGGNKIHGSGGSTGNVLHAYKDDVVDGGGITNLTGSNAIHASSLDGGATTIYQEATKGTNTLYLSSSTGTTVHGSAAALVAYSSGAGSDSIIGGAGNDTIHFEGSNDWHSNNYFTAAAGAKVVGLSGPATDHFTLSTGAATINALATAAGVTNITIDSDSTGGAVTVNVFCNTGDYGTNLTVINNWNYAKDTINFYTLSGTAETVSSGGHSVAAVQGHTLAGIKGLFAVSGSDYTGKVGNHAVLFVGETSSHILDNAHIAHL